MIKNMLMVNGDSNTYFATVFDDSINITTSGNLYQSIFPLPDGGVIVSFTIAESDTKVVIARLNYKGDYVWRRIFKKASTDLKNYAVSADSSGNVFAIIYSYPGDADIYKLSFSSGTTLVSKTINFSGVPYIHKILIDNTGNLYVAGSVNYLATMWKINNSLTSIEFTISLDYDTGATSNNKITDMVFNADKSRIYCTGYSSISSSTFAFILSVDTLNGTYSSSRFSSITVGEGITIMQNGNLLLSSSDSICTVVTPSLSLDSSFLYSNSIYTPKGNIVSDGNGFYYANSYGSLYKLDNTLSVIKRVDAVSILYSTCVNNVIYICGVTNNNFYVAKLPTSLDWFFTLGDLTIRDNSTLGTKSVNSGTIYLTSFVNVTNTASLATAITTNDYTTRPTTTTKIVRS